MKKKELQIILGLNIILSFRMLNIFMILPVLTGNEILLKDSNAFLTGIAIGIYGIMQVIFQIPYGLMSDKIGRKYTIIGGLIIFAIGSIITSISNKIWYIIIGRTIQGLGITSAPIIAALLEYTQVKNRNKIMAIIGINLGITFGISLILGPFLNNKINFQGLCCTITILTILSILIAILAIPYDNNRHILNSNNIQTNNKIKSYLQIINFNICIFLLHTILMLNFNILPTKISLIGIQSHNQWKIYLIIIIISFIIAMPCIQYAEKINKTKQIIIYSVMTILTSEIFFLCNKNCTYTLLLGIQLFFIAFNIMEAILPISISKISSHKYQGTNMGIYSTSQLLGLALGSILGGWLLEIQGINSILILNIILVLIWLIITCKIKH